MTQALKAGGGKQKTQCSFVQEMIEGKPWGIDAGRRNEVIRFQTQVDAAIQELQRSGIFHFLLNGNLE